MCLQKRVNKPHTFCWSSVYNDTNIGNAKNIVCKTQGYDAQYHLHDPCTWLCVWFHCLQEVYTNGLRGLVELTSVSIELFRKMAEVSLLPQVLACILPPVNIHQCNIVFIVPLFDLQATKANTIEQAERFNRCVVNCKAYLSCIYFLSCSSHSLSLSLPVSQLISSLQTDGVSIKRTRCTSLSPC